MRHLGLAPDREHTRLAQSTLRPYQATGKREFGSSLGYLATDGVQQPIYNIHDQLFGSCAGEAFGAYIESRVGYRISSIGIWRDARRRQGQLEKLVGTRLEYCIESLMRRGWDRYESGEESNVDEMTKPDDLDSEMDAYDHRESDLKHFRISTVGPSNTILDSIDHAIDAGHGVVFGAGVQQGYMDYFARSSKEEKVVGPEWLSGDSAGHAQRIFSHRTLPGGERQYGVQGSWSEQWGGMTLLNGVWQPGCCWVRSEVLLIAWDIHVMQFSGI